jgi:glycosyltransferase involved in cell wall biosynthesis
MSGTSLPLVSVIIPVHNGERFLGDAVQSAVAQDHRPLEVIVVDDGSTDGSGMLADRLAAAHPEVRATSQPNAGPAAARNLGITLARGDMVAFLDADDVWPPGSLSSRVRHLAEHPEVGCVLGRQEQVLEPGIPEPAWLAPDPILGDPGGLNLVACLVRRSVLEDVGGFDPSYRVGEGLEWLGRLRSAGVRTDVLDRVILRRRVHERNLTHHQDDMRAQMLRTMRARVETRRSELG